MHVFLSHNYKDKDKVRRLADRLIESGQSVWLDEDNVMPGELWQDKLQKAIDDSYAIVVVVSRHTAESRWQTAEISHAIAARRHQEKKVIPVLIEQVSELPFFLRDVVYCDLSTDDKFDRNFDSLLKALSVPMPPDQRTEAERDTENIQRLQEERELFEMEVASAEKKSAVRTSAILGAFSSILATVVAAVALFGGTKLIEWDFLPKIAPFVSGVLFGVLSSIAAVILTKYFQARASRREDSHER